MKKEAKKDTTPTVLQPGQTMSVAAAPLPVTPWRADDDGTLVKKIQAALGNTQDGLVTDSLLNDIIFEMVGAPPLVGTAIAPGDTVEAMEKRLGATIPLLRTYFQWGDATKIAAQLTKDAAAGRRSYISIKPPSNSWTTWPQIVPTNAQFPAIAAAISKNPNSDVSFHHEPENDRAEVATTASNYIGAAAAQKHRDAFKTAFRNFVLTLRPLVPKTVEFNWTPMDYTLLPQGKAKWGDLDLWNPGDDVVDVQGMDCYNGQNGLDASLAYAKKHGKRLIIGECGVHTTDNQVGWLNTLDAWQRANVPEVVGFCWWSADDFKLSATAEAELAALIKESA